MHKEVSELKLSSPRLPKQLTHIDLSEISFSDSCFISHGCISNCTLVCETCEHITIEQILFKNAVLSSIRFRNIELTDVRFEGCDLSNADFSGAVLYRCEFIDCKIVGLNLSDSTLRDVLFHECYGQYASLRFSNHKSVFFKDCMLRYSDFEQCSFVKVLFSNVDLTQAQMSGTRLSGIDFTNCEIDGLGIRAENLCGAIVTPAQAISLSTLLGIIIKA